tara:strand:- start:26 stop:520 length:495 start_codon:yes stop_codon:yes gene_type:complete
MQLKDMLDKHTRKALASVPTSNKRARSNIIDDAPSGHPSTGSTHILSVNLGDMANELERIHYADAVQYVYENQRKFGVYVELSYSECAHLVYEHLKDRLARPSCPYDGRTAGHISDDNFHPKYEFRRKSRRGQRPSGSYREDQERDAESIWLSSESIRKIKGLT